MTKICTCGQEYHVAEWQLRSGRGKFCSKRCYYDNPSPNAGFQKGHETLAGVEKGWFNKGMIPHNWKGDSVGYCALHEWVKKRLVRPVECEHCGADNKRLELANKSHEYNRNLEDWLWLCRKCHVNYDRQTNSWGLATAKYGGRL